MGTKLKLVQERAIDQYPTLDATGKSILHEVFGKELFAGLIPIMDRLKSWEDACEITGEHPANSLPYPVLLPGKHQMVADNGFHQMCIIADILNEGWVPDYNDSSQAKWEPVFKAAPSGFGLAFSYADDWYALTFVGTRLVFETREKAEYAGKQFISIYNKFLTKQISKTDEN